MSKSRARTSILADDRFEWYQIAAENTSDVIVIVDNERVVRFVSPSIRVLTGYEMHEYEGMDAFYLIHPDDRDRVRGHHASVVRTMEAIDVGYRVIRKDGNLIYVESTVKTVLDEEGMVKYVVAVVRDITKRKEAEQAREESEQRYKSLFEHNLDGVFSIDLAGFRLVNANPAFEHITGIPLAKIADRCFLGIIFDEDHPEVYGVLHQVVQHGKPSDIECRLATSSSTEKIVSITFVPIFLAGQLNGIHAIVKDITKRKQDEKTLIESEQRSKFLQQSLNRFSNDLANVMKVSELEIRLVDEVRSVIQSATDVSVEEVPRGQEAGLAQSEHTWISIGETKNPVYLRIALSEPLQKHEEEWLETAVHYAAILYDNLHLIEDLMQRVEESVAANETPKWMLRLLFKLSEKERASLSSDLHDSVLQDLIIWYRKLESLRSLRQFDDATRSDMKQIEEGLLDAIHQIRITCNELRPPFLLKMGLVESLKSLFEYTRMFANYEIEFCAEQLQNPLNEEQILGLYRIVQELLNNANKHSKAETVRMSLEDTGEAVIFTYSDDGVGMELSAYGGSFQHMGISGIEKRVLSLEGSVEFRSAPDEGFHVNIEFPIKEGG